jgi:hypothetical protein
LPQKRDKSRGGTPRDSSAEIAAMGRLTQQSTAWLLGISQPYKIGPKSDAPRNGDGSYNARDMVAWFVARNSDDLLGGPVTDNLDRLRAVNADIKTLELEKLRASMVSVADAKAMVFHTLGKVKTSIEHIQRRFGNDAADLVIEAVEVALKDLSDWIATADK